MIFSSNLQKPDLLTSKVFVSNFYFSLRTPSAPVRSSDISPRRTRPRPGGQSALRNSSAAFTLIELVAVLGIIFTLMGIILGAAGYITRNAMESRTKAEIKVIETALEAYKADQGGYPPIDMSAITNGMAGGVYSTFIYRALSGANNGKVYIQFKPSQISGVGSSIILIDPYGNALGYNPKTPTANPMSFDLYSNGFDGKTFYPAISNNVDDIGNW
jgi:type II secretory pathway pseudopilin PulG